MRHGIIILLCLLLLNGCTGRMHTKIENSDGIDPVEVAYMPKTKQDLMSVSDTLSNFWYSTDSKLPSMNGNAYWLMNRMMQMKCEAVTSEEDWAWMQAMGDYVAEYNSRIYRSMDKRASENMTMQDIENLIDHYSGGNQPELNT